MAEIPHPLMDVVRAHPDDDAPRLVVADWLEEYGDPARAAFVRAQLEAARAPDYAPETLAARRRAAWLEDLHGERWRGELPALEGISYGGFERGFVSTAVARQFRDLTESAATLASHTCVRTMKAPWPTHPEDVRLALPRSVHRLELVGDAEEGRAAGWLASAAWLDGIRVLDVGSDDPSAIETVLRCPHLRGVRRLKVRLRGADPGLVDSLPLGLDTLQLSLLGRLYPYADPVFELDLDRLVGRLSAWDGLGSLRALGLDAPADPDLTELLSSPRLSGLRALWLLSARALPTNAAPVGLRELWVEDLTATRVPAPWLHGVESLTCLHGALDLVGWSLASPCAASVCAARFGGGVVLLPEPDRIPRLSSLDVSGIDARMGRLGVRHLRTRDVAALRCLDLDALEWLEVTQPDDSEWDAYLATPVGQRLARVEGGLRRRA